MAEENNNTTQLTDILKAANQKALEVGIQEQKEVMARQQDFYTQQFLDLNTQFMNMQRQQASLNQQIMSSYFPYTSQESILGSAIEMGVPLIAGGLAGKFQMSRTGSFAKGALAAIGAGGLTYAGVTPAVEQMRGSAHSIAAAEALTRLQESGRMNAYMSMGNWATQHGRAFAPEYFETEVEQPLQQFGAMLGVSSAQLGPGVADLVSSGVVSGTTERGRTMNQVIKEASVVFKSLEAFFGSVDIAALRQKIGGMLQAGFTPESMAQTAAAMQSSIFAYAPEQIRNTVTQKAVSAGSQFANMGFAPSMGSELFITGYESAYRQFGQMDEYNQFRFRTPGRMANIQQAAMQNYMNNAGFMSVIGGGDFEAGISSVVNRFDMASPEGMREYERFKFERSMNMGGGDIYRTITKQAQDMASVYGVDFQTGLELILGNRDAATAFSVSLKDRQQRVTDLNSALDMFGITGTDVTSRQGIINSALGLGGAGFSSLGGAAIRMARSQITGGASQGLLEDTSILGGYFDPARGVRQLGLDLRQAGTAGLEFITPETVSNRMRSAIEEQAGLLSNVVSGAAGIAGGTGPLPQEVEAAINELASNPEASMVLTRGATTGAQFDRQTLASALEGVGANRAARLISSGSGESLGQLYQGLQERGYTNLTRMMNQTLFGGVDLLSDVDRIALDTQLVTSFRGTSAVGKTLRAAGGALGAVSAGAAVGGIATAVTGIGAPVGAVLGTVSTVTGIAGAAATGLGYAHDALFGDSISRVEASGIDQNLWGGELVVSSIMSLFIEMKSFLASLTSFKEEEKQNFIIQEASFIYEYLYNQVYIRKSEDPDNEIIEDLISNMQQVLSSNAEDFVGRDVIRQLTSGDSRRKLANVASIVINYLRNTKTPMSIGTFRNRATDRAVQISGDITNQDVKDLMYISKQLDRPGFVQGAKARTSGFTKEQVQARQESLNKIGTNLRERFGITQDVPGLTRDILKVIGSKDQAGQPLSEEARQQKVSDILESRGVDLKEGTTAGQLVQSVEDIAMGFSTAMKNQQDIEDQGERIKSLVATLAQDSSFKKNLGTIFKTMAVAADL